jgi:hypothetical protein
MRGMENTPESTSIHPEQTTKVGDSVGRKLADRRRNGEWIKSYNAVQDALAAIPLPACGSICFYPPPKPRQAYVYFLLQDSKIVYIGRTLDIIGRITCHRGKFRGKFNDVYFVRTRRELAGSVEAQLICAVRPPLNAERPSALASSLRRPRGKRKGATA